MFLTILPSTAFASFARKSRCFSSLRALKEPVDTNDDDDDNNDDIPVDLPQLLDPKTMTKGIIQPPKSLSPSAVMEFKNCPQSYLFQYLWGLRQPTTLALAKGSMCHEALEKLFDLEPDDRSLETLQNLFRVSWGKHRTTDTYRILFEPSEGQWDTEGEKIWGKSGLDLLENYFTLENPSQIVRPNPVKREMWVRSDLTIDPSVGFTATGKTSLSNTPTFHVRGIVDRLDMYKSPVDNHVALRIVDYKTGKAPNLKYSPAMNEKILTETFYQLKIYALLIRQNNANQLQGLDLRMLRLLFLTSETGPGQYLDMDLGATSQERDAMLNEIHVDLSDVWTRINALVETQDPKAFVGCNRSFCYCHTCRTRFLPHSLWEPN